jgi:hypothetical protein
VGVGVLRGCKNRQGVKYDLATPYPETVDGTESYLFFCLAKKDMVLKPFETDIHFYVHICMPRTERNLTLTFISVESCNKQMGDAHFT